MVSSFFRVAAQLVTSALLLTACDDVPLPAADAGGDAACPAGSRDCPCAEGDFCDSSLECVEGACLQAPIRTCNGASECPDGSECASATWCQTVGTRRRADAVTCGTGFRTEACACEEDSNSCGSGLLCEEGTCATERRVSLPAPPRSPCLLATSSRSAPVCIWELAITKTHDGLFENPELELYLRDEFQILACAGEAQGLLEVDAPLTSYEVRAHFIRRDGSPLRMEDLPEGPLFIDAAENDDAPCQDAFAPSGSDRTLGQSQAFSRSDLEQGVVTAFGDVPLVRFGAGPMFSE